LSLRFLVAAAFVVCPAGKFHAELMGPNKGCGGGGTKQQFGGINGRTLNGKGGKGERGGHFCGRKQERNGKRAFQAEPESGTWQKTSQKLPKYFSPPKTKFKSFEWPRIK